jgi:hypothetical protein
MSASWMVNVAGRAYGPYTDAQMAAFAAEGRVTPQSSVAHAGETDFRPAADQPALAPLFATGQPQPAKEPPKRSEPKPAATFGRENQKTGEVAHFLIVADMKSSSVDGLADKIHSLGQACTIVPQVWLLKTDESVNAIRNHLVQQLGKLDVLFIVDCTNDKAAWFNFGPEPESRIRRVWSRVQDAAAKAGMTGRS